MDIITIKDKNELIKYKEGILNLFGQVFGQSISEELWRWAYIDNPFGDPSVALCLDDGVVAHYAVIPFPLEDNFQNKYNAFLSMTTMVASSHRKYGLFTKLATETYRELASRDADWVMGFPNAMSAPGFQKRLGWNLLDADHVVSVNRQQLIELARLIDSKMRERPGVLSANLNDKAMRDWRLAKPGSNYNWKNGVAYKKFKDEIDVIYYECVESLQELPEIQTFNLLVPRELVGSSAIVSFDYQFGGIGLNKEFPLENIRRQMCMSDVF